MLPGIHINQTFLRINTNSSPLDSEQKQDNDPYDWVIFLGGTNDLGWGKGVDEIWNTILKVIDIPLREGARVLLMTVPECKVKHRVLDEKRIELNSRIRGYSRNGV